MTPEVITAQEVLEKVKIRVGNTNLDGNIESQEDAIDQLLTDLDLLAVEWYNRAKFIWSTNLKWSK